MTIQLVVSPNPVARPASGGDLVSVGVGLTGLTPRTRYNVRFDGAVQATFKSGPHGQVGGIGIPIWTTTALGNHSVDLRDSANKVTLGGPVPLAVQDAVPASPPPPAPPPITQTPDPVVRQATSILDLKQKIADNAIDKVLLVGSFALAPSLSLQPNSLFIGLNRGANGADMTKRTRPIIVDTSQAILTGNGQTGSSWAAFMDGAHSIEWIGLAPKNCGVSGDGIVKIGGDADDLPAYDLKLHVVIDATCRGTSSRDQALYLAHAKGRGPHDIEVWAEIDCAGGLYAAIHGYHSAAGAPMADHVTIHADIWNATIATLLWDPTVHDWVIDGQHRGTKQIGLSYYPTLYSAEQAPKPPAVGSFPPPASIAYRLVNAGSNPAGYAERYLPGGSIGLVA